MSFMGIKNMIDTGKKILRKGPLALTLIKNDEQEVFYNTLVTVANKLTLSEHQLYAMVEIKSDVKEENNHLSSISKTHRCKDLVIKNIHVLVETYLNKDIEEEVYEVTDVVLYAFNETVIDGYYLGSDPGSKPNQPIVIAKQVLPNDAVFSERDICICELPRTPFFTARLSGHRQQYSHRTLNHEPMRLTRAVIELFNNYAETNSYNFNEPHWFKFNSTYPLEHNGFTDAVAIYTNGQWKTFIAG